MKVISVAQGKGGVGKTTDTIALGLYASRKPLRVLLIDADTQANLTASFISLDEAATLTNTYNLIQGEAVTPVNVAPNIDLVPASPDLLSIDNVTDLNVYFRFGENIRSQFASRYDLVLVDTPGNLGTRVIAALTAADIVFSPSQPNSYANQALAQLLDLIRTVKQRLNPNLHYAGVVMNAVKGITESGEATQVQERAAIKAFTDANPGALLGLVGMRAVVRDTFSQGKWLPNDEAGQKAAAEVAFFSEKLLVLAGLSHE